MPRRRSRCLLKGKLLQAGLRTSEDISGSGTLVELTQKIERGQGEMMIQRWWSNSEMVRFGGFSRVRTRAGAGESREEKEEGERGQLAARQPNSKIKTTAKPDSSSRVLTSYRSY